MVEELTGTGVALVTPFDQEGNIDFPGFKRLLEHTAKGVDYWVVQGTTGESATTTAEEKHALLKFAKENNPKNLPLVYGIGGNNTAEVLRNIQDTDLSGVTALLSVSPAYNKPSQEGIIKHFEVIAEASPVPVMLYNVPGRTGSNMKWETTVKLAEHPNILGIKEASGDLSQCMRIAAYKPRDFLLISGDDILTPAIIANGGVGLVSVLANAFPQMGDMTRAALSQDYQKARDLLFPLLAINPLLYKESNPVGIKQALKEMGICEAYVRLPLLSPSEKLQSKIRQELINQGFVKG